MAPKAADVIDPAAAGAWFEAADNYDEEFDKAKGLFLDLRSKLPAKDGSSKGPARRVLEEDKFLDTSFPIERDDAAAAPCWFIGGKQDEVSDYTSAPQKWQRISDLMDAPAVFSPKKYTCLVQGTTANGYLVEAMQAVAMREHLVRRLLPHTFDVERGLYVVLLYKNACWVRVPVDDYIPVDAHNHPMCCVSYAWPSVCWPAIVEKAYASRHGSYEGIGGGGSVAEALVDLTGGVAGQFGVRDVSAERLFTYLHELQAEALFVARVDTREASKPGIRLTTRAPYVINRAMGHEGGKYLQLCCPGITGGPFDDELPSTLAHSRFFPERAADGFFWVKVEEFQKYFAEIVECRLVACDKLDDIQLFGQPVPRPLGMQRPHSHRLYATLGTVRASTAPEFRIHVDQGAGPAEVYLMLSQDDCRLRDKDFDHDDRLPYAPMLVRVYQVLSGRVGGCAKIAQSGYGPHRDAFVGFKAAHAAEFLVRVTMPVGATVTKLILRCDATAAAPHVELIAPTKAALPERHTWIEPKEPLAGFPMSFAGRSSTAPSAKLGNPDPESNPEALHARAYAMGYGHPRGARAVEGEECAVQ